MKRPAVVRGLIVALIVAAVAVIGTLAYQRYQERHVVTKEADGAAVTRLVAARLSGMSKLKVAQLAGVIQSTASDVRGFGWLRSGQVIKMPFTVDYHVDLSRIGPGDVEWIEQSRTLIVDAPDVTVAPPNTDEGRRSLVRTTGIFVTREAGEELSRRTSLNAGRKAAEEASSPARMARAREHARAAIAAVMTATLAAQGYSNARVIVTFPPERGPRDSERWDRSRRMEEVTREQQPRR